MTGHYLKRWLYLMHRWIGIVSCLFFAMWFASGLVMLYAPYPDLEREEWLAGQQPIDWSAVRVGSADIDLFFGSSELRSLSLEMRGEMPVWRRLGWNGDETIYSATDGGLLLAPEEGEVREIASLFAGEPVDAIESIERDQWTVAGGYDAHRPLWKASIDGPGGREIYLSSRTGEVLLETTAQERFWNWLGSVPHWIYPTVLRQNGAAWRQVVLWLSGPCIIAAITGIWIGILRVRLGERRFKGGRVSPYHGWMWWHHITGLAGSLFLVLWIFSGWLSVDPGYFFTGAGPGPGQGERLRYAGRIEAQLVPSQLEQIAPQARRITLAAGAREAYVKVERPGEGDRYVDPATLSPMRPDPARILDRLAILYPNDRITGTTLIEQPDMYWYSVNGELALPVLRAELDDPARTWLHLNPVTGEVLGTLDQKGRIYRWVYDLFHRWDLNALLENRLVRDVLIWVFSLFGLVSSITGVKIGWARLRPGKSAQRPRRRPERITALPETR